MQEKFRVKSKKLCFGFVDWGKHLTGYIPREVIRWTMHKICVDEWLVSAVMSLCMWVHKQLLERCSSW